MQSLVNVFFFHSIVVYEHLTFTHDLVITVDFALVSNGLNQYSTQYQNKKKKEEEQNQYSNMQNNKKEEEEKYSGMLVIMY